MRSPWRKMLWVALIVLGLSLVAGGVTLGPYLFERNAYAGVTSIEQRSDYRDRALMAAAQQLPVARLYQAHPYEYQRNPSLCGPASLANLLRSFGKPTTQQQVIDGTNYEPWFGILIGGMTLDELAELVQFRSTGPTTVIRDPSLEEFRGHMALTNDPARRYIVNFHRGPLFGRGHGHFSPILGYLADRDLVLVGDVNAEYRPFLVSSERLWKAMNTVDTETGRARGLILTTIGRNT